MSRFLFHLEVQTLPVGAVRDGLVAHKYASRMAAWGAVGLLLALWPWHGAWAIVLAPLLARLLALDATAYLLPHLYTVPVLALGVWAGQGVDALWWIIPLLLVRWVALRLPWRMGLSGGDFMLLAAMLAWLMPHMVCVAALLGCVVWLPVVWVYPKRDIPLGVPLIIGWALFSAGSLLPWPALWPIYNP